jgi:predicted lipid carrier protein YhbT
MNTLHATRPGAQEAPGDDPGRAPRGSASSQDALRSSFDDRLPPRRRTPLEDGLPPPRRSSFEDRLPPPLREVHERLRALVRRLPTQPPSFVAARVLDRLLLPRLDAGTRQALAQRTVEVELVETGVRVRLQLSPQGFRVAPSRDEPAVRIRARTDALWRLARGEDDADRLFFEGQLVMEGDTEYGLILKNTLDAIGPLWGGHRSP